MQQHVAAGGGVLRRRVLDLVVADAVLAGDEDHGRRAHVGHVLGVVPGAADHVHVRQVQAAGGAADRGDAAGVKGGRRRVPDFVKRDRQPHGRLNGRRGFPHGGGHGCQRRIVGVPQVDREVHPAGNDVARVGVHPQVADRADAVRRLRQRRLLHGGDDQRGAAQGVASPRHGGGAGVRFHARDRAVEPALPLQPLHHADDARVGLQQRPLLDVRLEEGVHRLAAAGPLAGVADAVQFLGHGDAVVVGARQAVFQAELAAEHAGGQHGGREAAALLVGPRHHLHGSPRRVAGVVERADDLQAGENPVGAVELAAGRLGVQVAAGHHRRQGGVGAGAAGKDVAHLVHLDGAAGLLRPTHEQVASLTVHVAQGDAADTAARCRANARQGHQRLPKARAVNPQVGHLTPLRKRSPGAAGHAGAGPHPCGPTGESCPVGRATGTFPHSSRACVSVRALWRIMSR